MEETAVVLLEDGELVGVLGDGEPGSDCLGIPGYPAEGGKALTLMVSDADVLSAVVPASVVTSLSLAKAVPGA